jgi:twitching motility protein PilT
VNQPIYEIPVNGGEPPRVEPPSFPPPGHSASAFAPPSLSDYGPPSVPTDVHVIDVDVAIAPVAAPQPPHVAPAATAPTAAPAAGTAFPPPSAPAAGTAFPPPSAPAVEFPVRTTPRLGADTDLIAALSEVLIASGSDLHVSANSAPLLRVDGALRPIGDVVWDRTKVMTALYSIMNEAQRTAYERDLELDFAFTLSANARFRVNYYQQRNAVGAAFRLIPTEIKQLKELGIPEKVSQFSQLPRGLVLVTGPTGSGKSTTLAALIDLVNRTRADHIMTVEDPIEYLHTNQKALINQREVGYDTHSFDAALKHVLRQDPDVILVGELRDLETISVALTAAETGHLVFATLHTQDAAQTIDRIIDVYPPHQQAQVRTQLASTLQGIVCQTLVKRSGGAGRVVAAEVLVMTPAIANLIREGKTYQVASAMQSGRSLGMITLDQHLAELVNAGSITHQTAIEKAHDVTSLNRMVTRVDVNRDKFDTFSMTGQEAR